MTISFEELEQHEQEYNGYCTQCEEFTRFGGTEPDAINYHCPECNNDAVQGTHWVIIQGLVEIQ